jgi:hypothetical protein
MSCWVVPSIAAEFWGVSVAEVLEGIRSGKIASKAELGFTLVDVVPDSPRVETGFRRPATPPATYTETPSDELSEAEHLALEDVESAATTLHPTATLKASSEERFDWRAARQSASRQRRSPRAASVAA